MIRLVGGLGLGKEEMNLTVALFTYMLRTEDFLLKAIVLGSIINLLRSIYFFSAFIKTCWQYGVIN